jgi:2-amino-4-hydroxy-6-hydroxymethyldihydropteridine diphosphokinase
MGANLGERERTIRAAIARLESHPALDVEAVSELIETAPVGGPPQPLYINGAARLSTDLPPRELLALMHRVEDEFGRRRATRWGARTLDLDLLLYDELACDSPELTLPHPRMHERRFVLAPLAQVGADALHPTTGRTVGELLEQLERDEETASPR